MTDRTIKTIEPCPLCARHAALSHRLGEGWYQVICQNSKCGCRTGEHRHLTPDQVIEMWNGRAAPANETESHVVVERYFSFWPKQQLAAARKGLLCAVKEFPPEKFDGDALRMDCFLEILWNHITENASLPKAPDSVDAWREIGECWKVLQDSGFPPEASGWPFVDIKGELPNAISCAIDCLIKQREELLAEVTKYRKAATQPPRQDVPAGVVRPEALAALKNYMQADADGVMVCVSRQALDEAIAALAAPDCGVMDVRETLRELLEIEDVRIATGAFKPNAEAQRRIDNARAALASLPQPRSPTVDARRLDWLQERVVDTIYLDGGKIIDVRGGDLRTAIDAAMGPCPNSLEDDDGENKPVESLASLPKALEAAPIKQIDIGYIGRTNCVTGANFEPDDEALIFLNDDNEQTCHVEGPNAKAMAQQIAAAVRSQPPPPDVPAGEAIYGIIDPDYARIFTMARVIGWSHGYAILFHGSFTRDLDLIAVPWAASACEPDKLVRLVAESADLNILAKTNPDSKEHASEKEHGRLAWTLTFKAFADPRFIDFSIMPRLPTPTGDAND
jgi:hypothetical protein